MKNMCTPFIDKTILNLLAILIAGAGLFAILIKFDVPELNFTFFDENPYGIKRDIIEKILTWIFIVVALFGLLIQTYSVIVGDKLSERLYSTSFYTIFFLIGLVAMFVAVVFLGAIGKCIAKKIWWPQIIQKQSEGFQLAEDIIRNKGFYKNELDKIEKYSEEQKQQLPLQRYKQCDKILTQIENLLEIKNVPRTREERYINIEKYFKK